MTVKGYDQLVQGLTELGLVVEDKDVSLLLDYSRLLQKWNKAFNLTTVDTTSGIISQHLLDSLAITPYIKANTILDVGSGAGLPGIPLAILFPDIRVTMLDSNGKKTRFINQTIMELGLENADVVQTRVEQYRPELVPGLIVTRAFAPLERMVKSCGRILQRGVPLLAMKAAHVEQELEDWSHKNWDIQVEDLTVPGISAKRYAVLINKKPQ